VQKAKIFGIIALFLILLFSGCADSLNNTGSYGGDEYYSTEMGFEGKQPAPSSDRPLSDAVASGERIVIKTGRSEIEAPLGEIETRLVTLKNLIGENSGTIENISYRETESRKSYTLEVKLSPTRFEQFSNSLKAVGTVKSLSTESEDVTFEYIDLEAKIENLQAQKQRLLEIYEKADKIEEILEIEREINRVQTQIDSSTARKKFLERQVERATLYITLYEEAAIVDQTLLVPAHQAINTGVGAMSFGILVISGLTGFMLPFFVAGIIILLLLWAIKKIFFRKWHLPIIGKKK
jgi:hypothetical protein